MAYCYDGKTYETIKEMAEEYGIDRQRINIFLPAPRLVARRCNANVCQ